MTIQEIYEAFDKIGSLSFATINVEGEPEARIAHLRAYDDAGIYFMTMYTKDFYQQLKATGKVSVNGLCGSTEITHDADGFPVFEAGYAIRMTGTVTEIPMAQIKAKRPAIQSVHRGSGKIPRHGRLLHYGCPGRYLRL